MNHEKHNARGQAGIVGEAVTSPKTNPETSPGQHITPATTEQPRPCATVLKRCVVWMGLHGFLPVFVACWLIQALKLAEV